MDKLATYLVTSPTPKTVIAQCSSGQVYVGSDYREFLQFLVNSANRPVNEPRVVWNIADLLAIIKSVIPQGAADSLSSDKVYEGDRCSLLLDAIKASPLLYIYGDIDLLSLSGSQDRYFSKYPPNGGELLKRRSKSLSPVSK